MLNTAFTKVVTSICLSCHSGPSKFSGCKTFLHVFENFLVCFIIAAHMLHDDVTIKQIKNVS